MNPVVIGIEQTKKRIRAEAHKMAQRTGQDAKDPLSKGVYISLSNANVKRSGRRPKPGKIGSRAAGDYVESPKQIPVLYHIPGRRELVKWKGTTQEFIDRFTKDKVRVDTGQKTKSGKAKTRKIRRYNLVRLRHQKFAQFPYAHEIFRKGGGEVPKSWAAGGIANYYLRRSWRSRVINPMNTEISIAPADFDNDIGNDKVLKLLEEGGTMIGGPRIRFWEAVFEHQPDGTTNVGFYLVRRKERKIVTVRGRHFVRKTINRIRQKINTSNISSLSASQWRQLGTVGQ